MSGWPHSSSSGNLRQDVEDDDYDDSDSAEEMKLSQEYYPAVVETGRRTSQRSRSSSGTSAGDMQLSQEFYTSNALTQSPSSQRQPNITGIFEIQEVNTEEPTDLDFHWGIPSDQFGRVLNLDDDVHGQASTPEPTHVDIMEDLYGDVALDALEDLFGQGSGQAATAGQIPVDIMEDLLILSDIGFKIDYPNGLLGKGSFGSVYLGSYNQNVKEGLVTSHPFAVKIIDFGKFSASDISLQIESFETEKYVLTNVNHRNVVTIRNIINMGETKSFPFSDNPSKSHITPDRAYMFMDYADGGELYNYMENNRTRMEPSLRINFIRDLFFGMWYLHQNKIIHGDVHSGNVLIFKNENIKEGEADLVAKWSDFGLSYVEHDTQDQYRSQKMPQRHEYKYDIQDLHTIIHEILGGRRQCRSETREEKQRLDQCADMADFMMRNHSLHEVYNVYHDVLEDQLDFDEHHFS